MAATFKIEKLKDYTIMTNHHLRNRDLSLKAKGLHSLMLSLPEEWNYTLSGLVKLSRDGKDAVMSALKELEKHKYLFRHQTQINTPNGNRFSHMEYYIFQVPYDKPPYPENPYPENPNAGKPYSGNQYSGNPKQSNINISNTNQINYPSINHGDEIDSGGKNVENLLPEPDDNVVDIVEYIKQNINYDSLCRSYSKEVIDGIVDVMTEVFCAQGSLYINRQKMSCKAVQRMYDKLDYDCVVYVLDCIAATSKSHKIKNMKNYLMTALYNAPMTVDVYYAAQVNSDFESRDSG